MKHTDSIERKLYTLGYHRGHNDTVEGQFSPPDEWSEEDWTAIELPKSNSEEGFNFDDAIKYGGGYRRQEMRDTPIANAHLIAAAAPDLLEAINATQRCLGFLKSIAQCGEGWTAQAQREYDKACAIIDAKEAPSECPYW